MSFFRPRFGKDNLNARVKQSSSPSLFVKDCIPGEVMEAHICDRNGHLVQSIGQFQANGNGFINIALPSIPFNQGYKLIVGNTRAGAEINF